MENKRISKEAKLPDYWEQYMETRLARIKEIEDSIGENGDSLAFIADVHWPCNARYSPALLNWIQERTKMNKVIFGGDMLTIHSKEDAAAVLQESMEAYIRYFGNRFYYVNGNHDNNPYRGEEGLLTYEEQYDICMKHLEGSVVQQETGENGFHYYFDNEEQKIRYIILDTKNMQPVYGKQLKWFAETALDLPDGWAVAVFMHWAFNLDKNTNLNGSTVRPYGIAREILKAVKNQTTFDCDEFDIHVSFKNKIDVLFIASAHTHTDDRMTWFNKILPDEDGIISFTIASDAYQYNGETIHARQVRGTTGEQCFDIIQINREKRQINLTRIGFGNDRCFEY